MGFFVLAVKKVHVKQLEVNPEASLRDDLASEKQLLSNSPEWHDQHADTSAARMLR